MRSTLATARDVLERALSRARSRRAARVIGHNLCAITELQDFLEHYELHQATDPLTGDRNE